MHIRPLFAIASAAELQEIICEHALAMVVVQVGERLEAHPLPLEFVPADASGARNGQNERGVLRGHVPRSHSLWKDFAAGGSLLATFQGPNAYISPRWYVNGQRSGSLAPSWNYVAVQVCGDLRFIEDADWLLEHLKGLTLQQEAGMPEPWSIELAAADFVRKSASQLVGFEITINEITGKKMLLQQRTAADRASVAQHLRVQGSGTAQHLANLIQP